MLVKICANKNINDAKMCIDAGADFLGILVGQKHVSTDFIDKYTAKEMVNFSKRKIKLNGKKELLPIGQQFVVNVYNTLSCQNLGEKYQV